MARFWIRLGMLLLPLAALLGIPIAVLTGGGELTSVDSVIARQRRPAPLLYGPAYSNPVKRFKLRATEQRHPEILALGSSRVMQFRAAFFADPASFYNAGGAVSTVWDARRFWRHLDENDRPHVVLLGLDQWFFNPSWSERGDPGEREFSAEDTALNLIQRNWRTVYQDLRARKIEPARLLGAASAVGLTAIMRDNGFRNDGSYFYGECSRRQDLCFWDVGFQDTFQRIEQGERRFEWSDHVDSSAVDEVARFLSDARVNRTEVVAFLPPLAPAVLARMKASGHFSYIDGIYAALAPQFVAAGATLVDLTDASSLGATNAEFIDGFHGSDRTYVRILQRLAVAAPALTDRVDPADLQKQLETYDRAAPLTTIDQTERVTK